MPERPDPDGFLAIRLAGREVEVNAYRDSTLDDYAEAYAAARVRETLEEATKVCDAYFKEIEEQSRSTYEEGKLDAADILEQRIKALIPSQTGDRNVATD